MHAVVAQILGVDLPDLVQPGDKCLSIVRHEQLDLGGFAGDAGGAMLQEPVQIRRRFSPDDSAPARGCAPSHRGGRRYRSC